MPFPTDYPCTAYTSPTNAGAGASTQASPREWTRRTVSLDTPRSASVFLPTGDSASRRSSKTIWTTTAASTPRSNEDWPSAPNLYEMDSENPGGDDSHTLDLQLTQKTIAMLALIRGATPERANSLLDSEQSSLPKSVDSDGKSLDDQTLSEDLDDEGRETFDGGTHDYLIGGDFVEIDSCSSPSHIHPFDSVTALDEEDAEEDIFGMEL